MSILSSGQPNAKRSNSGFWLLSLTLPLLVACKGGNDPASSQGPSHTPVTAPTGPVPVCPPDSQDECPLRATTEALPEPNKYRVHLSWPAVGAARGWIIQREDHQGFMRHLITLEADKRSFVDASVRAGEPYRYELGAMGESGFVVRGTAQFKIPFDFLVTGVIPAPDLKGVNRVFFSPASRIITYGQTFEVNVNEIVSENGTIETFPEGRRADTENAGRAGGLVQIRAKTGRGVLHIVARGENGGAGAPGGAGAAGPKGTRGNEGQCDQRWTRALGSPVFNLIPVAYAGRDPGDIRDPIRRRLESYCKTQTGDGAPGGQGFQGSAGNAGRGGGDSAKVYVQIDDPARIQIKPYVFVGMGGSGGSGGQGGPGGPGGDPGDRRCNECRAANSGPPGGQGPAGLQGPGGPNGQAQPICLRLNSASFGDCDTFPRL